MHSPATSRHFSRHVDPSGAIYYVLDTHVAAQQQGFYFVNASMSEDGRYLWFLCSYPPARYFTLGVLDFETDTIHAFPETEYAGATPIVDAEGFCWYADLLNLYRRSPDPAKSPEVIAPLPPEITENHTQLLCAPACHLTFSPDKTHVLLDAIHSGGFIVGAMDIRSGKFQTWCRPDFVRNHGQFNPVHSDIALTAEDFSSGYFASRGGIRTDENGVFMRLWLVYADGTQRVIPPLNGMRATHEWWSADGRRVYYCRYAPADNLCGHINNGVCSYDIFSGEHKLVAPVPAWHGYSTNDDSLIVYDENSGFYRGCASSVGLYNVKTGKQAYIVTHNPPLNPVEKPSSYHLDPHPRFNAKEKYIVFTSAINGRPDVAVAFTQDVVPLTE